MLLVLVLCPWRHNRSRARRRASAQPESKNMMVRRCPVCKERRVRNISHDTFQGEMLLKTDIYECVAFDAYELPGEK